MAEERKGGPGLKSHDPVPHTLLLEELRSWSTQLVFLNVFAALGVASLSVEVLGGYALEHPAHNTAWTEAVEYVGAVSVLCAALLCLVTLSWRDPANVRRVNRLVLLIVWPAEIALIWALWQVTF